MSSSQNAKSSPRTWAAIGRVLFKALILFILINVLFAAVQPLDSLGELTLYNGLIRGRERLPYGENSAESYNLSLNNIPAMISSHALSAPKDDDEFRVIIIGDSGTWGWLLDNEDTLAGQINNGDYRTNNGRRIVAYNLGYPIMALSKDLLILDAALEHDPDLILWPVTLESFPIDKQLDPPLVAENPERLRSLVSQYDLAFDLNEAGIEDRSFVEETVVGRRRDLADLLRLQLYGFSWQATGVDQAIPEEITLRRSDFEEDQSWGSFENPVQLTQDDLAMDVLAAGVAHAGDVPILIINEPVFISQGENSDVRYNAWYPRWAYDQYRSILSEKAANQGWIFTDYWDRIPSQEFTDSPVHLTRSGMADLTGLILPHILQVANEE
jgi:hypothetical protein